MRPTYELFATANGMTPRHYQGSKEYLEKIAVSFEKAGYKVIIKSVN